MVLWVPSASVSAYKNATGWKDVSTQVQSFTLLGEGTCGLKNCTGLTSITCNAVTPPTCNGDVFYGVDKTIKVEVPSGSINAYSTAMNGKSSLLVKYMP